MKRSAITPERYFLSTIGADERIFNQSYAAEHLCRLAGVDGDLVTFYNLTTQEMETVAMEYLTDKDTLAITDDMADRVWRLSLTAAYEQMIRAAGGVISTYSPGTETVDQHAVPCE